MLKSGLFVLVACAALFQTSMVSAELKVGVYDNRKVLESLPSVQKQFEKLGSEFESKKRDLTNKEASLRKLAEEIEKNGPVLSEQALQAKQLEFQSKRRELQLLAEDTERSFTVRRNEVARNIQASVDSEVIKLAQEQSFDLVLRTGVIYASPKVDITDQILKRMSGK